MTLLVLNKPELAQNTNISVTSNSQRHVIFTIAVKN